MKLFLVILTLTAVFAQDGQYAILMGIYNSTNGASWRRSDNWGNATVSVCKWYGVRCDDPSVKIVTELDLRRNRLSGTIPDSIGKLSNLRNLVLNNNTLSGTIP